LQAANIIADTAIIKVGIIFFITKFFKRMNK
jgi:hypothetical protein